MCRSLQDSTEILANSDMTYSNMSPSAEPAKQLSFQDGNSQTPLLTSKELLPKSTDNELENREGISNAVTRPDSHPSDDPLCKDPEEVGSTHKAELRIEKSDLPVASSNTECLIIPQYVIRSRSTSRCGLSLFDCVLRAGPVGIGRKAEVHCGDTVLNSDPIGIGISVVLSLAQLSSKRFEFEFIILFLSIFRKLTFSLFCNLDCVRVVPRDASVFEAVRAGSKGAYSKATMPLFRAPMENYEDNILRLYTP